VHARWARQDSSSDPPPLARAIAPSNINGIGGDSVFFTDLGSRKEITMFMEDEEIVQYGNREITGKLKAIGTLDFAGVFTDEGRRGIQGVSNSMFCEK